MAVEAMNAQHEHQQSYSVRLPEDLWRELQALAAQDLLGVNAWVVMLLRWALARRKASSHPPA
jgi:hypothetical protein